MDKVNPIQLQKHLKGLDYPASKDEIVRTAQEQGADENVRQTLDRLPDREFQTPAEISEAVGEMQ